MANKIKSTVDTPNAGTTRHVGAFQSAKAARKYWIMLIAMLVMVVLFSFGLLSYENPMEFGSKGYWLIANRRLDGVIAMGLVAVCQAVATVAFHTVTNNRILTPSIMGFESLYRVIHTSTIFFFGAVGLNNARTV